MENDRPTTSFAFSRRSELPQDWADTAEAAEMTSAAFDRARNASGEQASTRETASPPQLVLDDPHPGFAEKQRHAERLWFAPVNDNECEMTKAQFTASRMRSQFDAARKQGTSHKR